MPDLPHEETGPVGRSARDCTDRPRVHGGDTTLVRR